jgi:serine/threonine protein kinase
MISEQHVLALPAGYELGKYRFQGVLGSGGFGITYLAEDMTLHRKVAIKEMLPNDFATRIDGTTVVAKTASEKSNLAWARARFVDEGRALAACDHPNVVNVYEMIEANGTAYMVTKYEEGSSLERWLRELGRAPSESELRGVLMPLLSGLERVHRAGFLHRDIKPENIYLTTGGRPVLLDFGSARQSITSRSMVMTSIVSAGYAPFEQYHEDGNQGAWSDIYALGAVLYRAITGSKPPEAVRRLQNDPCIRLATAYAGRYSASFLNAIDNALLVNESQRPQTVALWREMMDASSPPTIASQVPPAAQVTPATQVASTPAQPAPSPTFISRRPVLIAAGAVLLLLIAAGAWFFTRPKPVIIVGVDTNQKTESAKKANSDDANQKKQAAAEKSSAKEEPSASPTPATASVSPSPSATAAPQPSPERSPTAAEPSPTPKAVVQTTPKPPEPQRSPTQTRTPQTESSPAPSNTPASSETPPVEPPADQILMDPKLVGNWEGKPNGSKGGWDRHWEQQSDGTYMISGAVTESGALMARDGKIEKNLDGTQTTVEVLYKFNGSSLVTLDPDGSTVIWRPVNATASSKSRSGQSSGSQTRHTRHSGQSSGHSSIWQTIRRYFP